MMSDPKNSLFRKEALERLSSPERLDQLMQVVSLKDWLPLTALGSLAFLAGLWSIFGRIPITVTGQGMLLRPRQIVEFQSPISGQLKLLHVQDGQCIEKDHLLATVDPSDLRKELQLQQVKLVQLQAQAEAFNSLSGQRTQLEKETIAALRASLEQRLQDAQALTPVLKTQALNAIEQERQSVKQQLQDALDLSPVLQERLARRQQLLAAGALSEDIVLQAQREYRQLRQSVSQLDAQLKQLEVKETQEQQKFLQNLNTISEIQAQLVQLSSRRKRLDQDNLEAANQRENQIQDVNRRIAQLEKQIADKSEILSLQAGCVLEITVEVGQFVHPGTRLGAIEVNRQASQIGAIAYFAVKDGKRIQPGMPIQITPTPVKRERFGGIEGQVTQVSPFPVTQAGVSSILGNPDMVENLIGQAGAMIEARADLKLDPSTFSGYQWSSGKGPTFKISAGTTTTARVKVEERAPITFVLPILREWSGIN